MNTLTAAYMTIAERCDAMVNNWNGNLVSTLDNPRPIETKDEVLKWAALHQEELKDARISLDYLHSSIEQHNAVVEEILYQEEKDEVVVIDGSQGVVNTPRENFYTDLIKLCLSIAEDMDSVNVSATDAKYGYAFSSAELSKFLRSAIDKCSSLPYNDGVKAAALCRELAIVQLNPFSIFHWQEAKTFSGIEGSNKVDFNTPKPTSSRENWSEANETMDERQYKYQSTRGRYVLKDIYNQKHWDAVEIQNQIKDSLALSESILGELGYKTVFNCWVSKLILANCAFMFNNELAKMGNTPTHRMAHEDGEAEYDAGYAGYKKLDNGLWREFATCRFRKEEAGRYIMWHYWGSKVSQKYASSIDWFDNAVADRMCKEDETDMFGFFNQDNKKAMKAFASLTQVVKSSSFYQA